MKDIAFLKWKEQREKRYSNQSNKSGQLLFKNFRNETPSSGKGSILKSSSHIMEDDSLSQKLS